MEKPIKPVLFAIIVLAATVATAYTLNMLDMIVHGQLYHYGLLFDLAWANPYWNLLRIIQILLAVIAGATVGNTALTIRKYFSNKKPSVKITLRSKPTITRPTQPHTISSQPRTVPLTMRTPEKTSPLPSPPSAAPVPHVRAPPQVSAPAPLTSPIREPFSPEISGLIRCTHCGKAFTQPLRMLDFQGDRPRIVNICPFCNETITTPSRQNENEQESRFPFKKNNHSPKYLAPQ